MADPPRGKQLFLWASESSPAWDYVSQGLNQIRECLKAFAFSFLSLVIKLKQKENIAPWVKGPRGTHLFLSTKEKAVMTLDGAREWVTWSAPCLTCPQPPKRVRRAGAKLLTGTAIGLAMTGSRGEQNQNTNLRNSLNWKRKQRSFVCIYLPRGIYGSHPVCSGNRPSEVRKGWLGAGSGAQAG